MQKSLLRYLLLLTFGLGNAIATSGEFSARLADGFAYRQHGDLRLALDALELARQAATNDEQRALAAGELGATYLQARQFSMAQMYLHQAYRQSSGANQARYAIDLGNLALARKLRLQARSRYQEAQRLAGNDQAIRIAAALNEMRLALGDKQLSKLIELATALRQLPLGTEQARLALNLGHQAKTLGKPGNRLAYEHFTLALEQSRLHDDRLLEMAAYDALAQLYEDQQRPSEALQLSTAGIALGERGDSAMGNLLIQLYWRQGRLAQQQGRHDLALSAFQAAVEQIEAIRQDIPIEYEGEQSSFRQTLEPIYLGLANQLLLLSEGQSGDNRQATLRRVRGIVELIKQTEMQDYLGDRCSVDVTRTNEEIRAEAGVAVFYPIIFPDRLELLLETSQGMFRRTVAVDAKQFRQTALEFAALLREDPETRLPQSRLIYDWLIRPLDAELAGIDTLVVIPDGVIRMLPFAALHDGQRYLVEHLALATAPGLTMTNAAATDKPNHRAFVGGLAEPGPVVDKLSQKMLQSIVQPQGQNQSRSASDALALPGVKDEVEDLTRQLNSRSLLNQQFTLANFRQAVESGEYGIIHIASHGLFGGSGDQSFILTHDELLTMDVIQQVLSSEQLRKNRVRLLTLSACETADGNERAPLGIAGAALKARADAALGTLWPVEDNVAKTVMSRFYLEFTRNNLSKAKALQQAQLGLIHDKKFGHPFYWAPFIIVGNWQ